MGEMEEMEEMEEMNTRELQRFIQKIFPSKTLLTVDVS